jgi:cyanophycinase-like exopeptidase
MKRIITKSLILPALIASLAADGQSYTSWLTGSNTDAAVQPQFGLVLMGGASESDAAMQWFLERANGGDVVVIRASGSDGYNDYLYSDLGVTVNSVETILFNNATASNEPYVIERLNNAEAIWIAGGNQANYINYWRDTPVEDAINNLINVKGGVVGGTSAGMAVMGQSYFPALNGSTTQAAALANPFNSAMVFGYDDFIDAPFLENVITDTHFNDPDAIRYGRLTTFMARLGFDHGVRPFGIGANEYCATVIDEDGIARCFGEFGAEFTDDFIYFMQANCVEPSAPEVLEAGTPLTWVRNNEAVKVYRVPATIEGQNYFDLNTWNDGEGGQWMNWYVNNGALVMEDAEGAAGCILSVRGNKGLTGVSIYPNPGIDILNIKTTESKWNYTIFDISGRVMMMGNSNLTEAAIDIQPLATGIYKIAISGESGHFSASFVRSR